MKSKVYIAGKISGDPNYKAKFEAARQSLNKQGYKVLDPSMLPDGMRREDYMRICFAMIDTADVVAFLPDTMYSDGARVEYDYCRYIEKGVMYIETEKENGTH